MNKQTSSEDGKMYVAELLQSKIMTNMGEMDCRTDDICGVLFVFKSKASARKMFGKNVGFTEIRKKETL